MKRYSAVVIAVVMSIAACGSSDGTIADLDPEVEAIDDDGALRLAGGNVQVINGCRIEPRTSCRRPNLAGANLAGANLVLASLMASDLSGADLSGADLRRAGLQFSNLRGADLTGADLSRSTLTRVDLTGANLTGANLTGANLWGANLDETIRDRAIFCGTTMPDYSVRNDHC